MSKRNKILVGIVIGLVIGVVGGAAAGLLTNAGHATIGRSLTYGHPLQMLKSLREILYPA